LERLGFTQAEIENMSQAHSFEEVADSIVRLKAAEGRLKAAGRPISSKKAYFNGILTNIAAGGSDEDLDHDRIEAEARIQEAERLAAQREARLKEEFSKHVSDAFSRRLFEIADDEREALIRAFEQSSAGVKARLLIEKGWSPKNVGALSILRSWMAAEQPGALNRLINPEDRDFDSWLAWRLDSLG
jgi:hypothetical protein